MKNKPYFISIIFVLLSSVTFLLWYGERIISDKAATGYSIFSFLNSENVVSENDFSALAFKIENLEKNKISNTVSISLNEKQLDSRDYQIESKKSLVIEPDKKFLAEFSKDNPNNYTITINWGANNKNKETLRKQIQLQNETK
jgi:hypothetical protein